MRESLTTICDRAVRIEEENAKNGGDPIIRENVKAILEAAEALVEQEG